MQSLQAVGRHGDGHTALDANVQSTAASTVPALGIVNWM